VSLVNLVMVSNSYATLQNRFNRLLRNKRNDPDNLVMVNNCYCTESFKSFFTSQSE